MLRMVIVDDEPWAALGLSEIIDWNKAGFEIISIVYSGKQALNIILQEKPDIVFTDIRMKGMSGLQLVAAVQAIGINDCKFVLVSAYEDFAAAQEALKLGAFGYITKPLDPEEIQDIACRLRDSINKERGPLFLSLSQIPPFREEDAIKRISPMLAYPYAFIMLGEISPSCDDSKPILLTAITTDSGLNGVLGVCSSASISCHFDPGDHGMSRIYATNKALPFGGLDFTQMIKEAFWAWKCHFIFSEAPQTAELQSYFCENMALQLSIDQLAQQYHLAPTYLSSLFKKNTGMTIVQFRQHVRIHWAEWLMKDNSLKLRDIAEKVGFEDYNYFSRVFSNLHHGISPESYRNTLQA